MKQAIAKYLAAEAALKAANEELVDAVSPVYTACGDDTQKLFDLLEQIPVNCHVWRRVYDKAIRMNRATTTHEHGAKTD